MRHLPGASPVRGVCWSCVAVFAVLVWGLMWWLVAWVVGLMEADVGAVGW